MQSMSSRELSIGGAFLVASSAYVLSHFFVTQRAVSKNNAIEDKARSLFQNTPVIESAELLKRLNEARDSETTGVYLKLECNQLCGTHKVRMVATFITRQIAKESSKSNTIDTIICSSVGSIGIAAAFVAQKLGLKCKIFASNQFQKNPSLVEQFKNLNARVVFYGDTHSDCDVKAQKYTQDVSNNAIYVPYSFNVVNQDIAYYASRSFISYSKIIEEVTKDKLTSSNIPDCIVVPTTDGDLLAGVCAGVLKSNWQRDTKIVAAQLASYQLFEQSAQNNYEPVVVSLNGKNSEYLKYNATAKKSTYYGKMFKKKYSNPIKSMVINDEFVENNAMKTFYSSTNVKIPINKAKLKYDSIVAYAAVLRNAQYFAQFQDVLVIISGENYLNIKFNDENKQENYHNDDDEKYPRNQEEDDEEYYSDDEEP